MGEENNYMILRIRKRPWYIWFLGIIWIFWLLFWIENTFGAWKEIEYRAFSISLTVSIISLIIGLGAWFWERMTFKRK